MAVSIFLVGDNTANVFAQKFFYSLLNSLKTIISLFNKSIAGITFVCHLKLKPIH